MEEVTGHSIKKRKQEKKEKARGTEFYVTSRCFV